MRVNKLARPFLKWAGGKRQLVPEIEKHKPSQYNTYYEPFLGGGAIFFTLQPQKSVVNDSNAELINCYKVVKDKLDELIEDLRKHENEENYYYNIRDLDRNYEQYKHIHPVKRASRIIYLNKTCYNGLFRVNSQGQFNVPFGKYKNPNVLGEAVLKAVNEYLNSSEINILNADFEVAVETAKKDDFVYFDPPYDPISDTASFTGYDINKFDKNEQRRLRKVYDKLTERGCKVLLSNAYTDFVIDLYKKYQIEKVSAIRTINCNAFKRGKVDEVLILNYQPSK